MRSSRLTRPLTAEALMIVFVLGLHSATVDALRLESIGPTYPIAEPHFLHDLEQRLRQLEQSGELARRFDAAKRDTLRSIRRPPAVEGLRPTRTARTFYVDPSFTLERNLVDQRGRLLFAAGTRQNPLEVVALSKHLLFFDGRDRRQIEQAERLFQHYQGRIKPILTGGSYLDLMRLWKRPVFFDQRGRLVHRLGIRQVPALVSQAGLRLRVDELEIAP